MNSDLFVLENIFRVNNYHGIKTEYDSFVYIMGTSKVLLSAPHSVKHCREGNEKSADIYTGTIVRYINSITGCHAIYKSYNDFSDANYDDNSQDRGYKNTVEKIVTANDINVLVDIHGMSDRHGFDVDIGSDNGGTASDFIINSVIEIFMT